MHEDMKVPEVRLQVQVCIVVFQLVVDSINSGLCIVCVRLCVLECFGQECAFWGVMRSLSRPAMAAVVAKDSAGGSLPAETVCPSINSIVDGLSDKFCLCITL